jgi:hypothetical protein
MLAVNLCYKTVVTRGSESDDWLLLAQDTINVLKTERRLLYLKAQPVPRCKQF